MRHVVDVDDRRGRRSTARSSSSTRFFVTWKSHVVNFERSEKLRQPLEDAQEDLLGQVLGERPVADEAQHVVEDRHLIRAHDDRERTLVAALGLPEDAGSGWGRDKVRHR